MVDLVAVLLHFLVANDRLDQVSAPGFIQKQQTILNGTVQILVHLGIGGNAEEEEDKLFVPDAKFKFTKDDKVKIVRGKFVGFEGKVCRIKGQTRVGLIIEGVGTIFTAYIPKDYLEKMC